MKKFLITALSAILIPLSLAQSFAAEKPKVFRVRARGEPASLDWNTSYAGLDAPVIMNTMEGLVQISPDSTPLPSLAKNWEISADQKTYTFHLKSGVLWSDGKPLKAQHFVDSWKRVLSPSIAAKNAYLLFDLVGAEEFHQEKTRDFAQVGVKALDDLTLQVQLKQPVSYWIWIPTFWATFPIRQELIDHFGNLWTKPGNLVTLGPFSFTTQDHERSFTLKKNPTYHGRRGNIDEVQFVILLDDITALESYLDGKIDFMKGISGRETDRLLGRKDFHTSPKLGTSYLRLNQNQYPLTNPRVRKAISMAIDRTLLKKIHGANVRLATSFVPPSLLGFSEKGGIPFNPSQAKREIVASGINFQKHPLELIITKYRNSELTAQAIQAELKKNLGISVNIRVIDFKKYYSIASNMKSYALIFDAWNADFPDPDNFYSIFLESAGTNKAGWKNADYDELVLRGRKATNSSERKQIYQKADELLVNKDAIILPLFYMDDLWLLRDNIRGYHPSLMFPDLFKDLTMQ